VNLAARGSRQLSDDLEKIEDVEELARVRQQARSVMIKSIVLGSILFLFVMVIP
jgi:hypothetical protein